MLTCTTPCDFSEVCRSVALDPCGERSDGLVFCDFTKRARDFDSEDISNLVRALDAGAIELGTSVEEDAPEWERVGKARR